jgi:ERCC4-type nuclease
LLSREVSSVDVLRKLPGVTDHNWRAVRDRVKNLHELCALSEGDLVELLGAISGRELFSFLHKRKANAVK